MRNEIVYKEGKTKNEIVYGIKNKVYKINWDELYYKIKNSDELMPLPKIEIIEGETDEEE